MNRSGCGRAGGDAELDALRQKVAILAREDAKLRSVPFWYITPDNRSLYYEEWYSSAMNLSRAREALAKKEAEVEKRNKLTLQLYIDAVEARQAQAAPSAAQGGNACRRKSRLAKQKRNLKYLK